MRDKLLAAGVKNLTEYGYPSVTTENILTDYVFRAFFRNMLEETMRSAAGHKEAVAECRKLIAEIDACKEPTP